MAYVDPHNAQNPLENCWVQQSVSPPFFTKPHGGIALTCPCPHDNQGQKIRPRPCPMARQ